MSKRATNLRATACASALVLAGLAGGCDDGKKTTTGTIDTTGPLYIVSSRVTLPEGESAGYLASVSSLDGVRFDITNAIETTVGSVQADREAGYIYHASNREPLITRYKLEADGSFSPAGTLSFANLGYDSVGAAAEAPFFARDRAYFVRESDLVVWNPEALEIVGTVPLGVEMDGMLRPWLTLYQRPDRLFVSVFWESSDDFSIYGSHAQLIEIDPATSQIVSRTDEPRCNMVETVTTTSDGTAYFSSNAFASPMRVLLSPGHGVDPCVLRVLPGRNGFDPGYRLDLPALVGGRQAGDFAIVDDETALIRVWHPDLVDPVAADLSNWTDVLGENGHLWWRWKIGEATATQIPNQQPGAWGGEWYTVDGKRLFLQAAGDFSESTLLSFDGEGLTPAVTGPGYIFGIARVR